MVRRCSTSRTCGRARAIYGQQEWRSRRRAGGADDRLVHAATGEMVVPRALLTNDPWLRSYLVRVFDAANLDWCTHVVGGPNRINPATGLAEFDPGRDGFDESNVGGGYQNDVFDVRDELSGGGGANGRTEDFPDLYGGGSLTGASPTVGATSVGGINVGGSDGLPKVPGVEAVSGGSSNNTFLGGTSGSLGANSSGGGLDDFIGPDLNDPYGLSGELDEYFIGFGRPSGLSGGISAGRSSGFSGMCLTSTPLGQIEVIA